MVNNLEKFSSINFYAYCKMNQKKVLYEKYTSEYEYYLMRMDEYMVKLQDYNNTIVHNLHCERWQEWVEKQLEAGNENALYDIPVEFVSVAKKIPPIPCKPDEMEHPDEVDLYHYYKIEKFTTSWMLNVSPNWKGCAIDRHMVEFFIGVIELFFDNCKRFIKMKYVLENGHGKDHLHAHIVFTLNTNKPGYMTSIRKGNILNEWRNCWNRLAKDNESLNHLMIAGEEYYLDPVDLCKPRVALQTCLITTPEMLKDKLDYLCEELKPESHKNDPHPITPVKGSKGY